MAVLTKRLVKGTPLTAAEHDGNLDFLSDRITVLEGAAGALATQVSCIPTGGLSYSVQVTDLPLSGQVVSGGPTLITLADADTTYPRIDRILIDINGNITKKTGDAAESAAPKDYNPSTEYVIRDIFVDANATEGTDPGSGGVIGAEDVWIDGAVAGVTFASNSLQITEEADTSMSGTHLIQGVPLAAGEEFSLTFDSDKNVADYDSFIFDLLPEVNHGELIIYAYANGRASYTGNVVVTSGMFNYNDNNPGVIQTLAIPFSAFGFYTSDFNKFIIKHPSANNTWKMDNIRLGKSTSVGSLVLAVNSVGVEHLKPELKNHFAMANEVIDWNAGISGTRTFTGTPTVTFTELNAPTGDVSKTISVDMTGAVNSIAFPANYRKATNASEDYDGTKINKYVFEYVNGYVYYSNTLFNT